MNGKPLLAIGGATGSGKTGLAIQLAQRYSNLVVLSADSRQVFRRLDIGSAKVGAPGMEESLMGKPESVWYSNGIPQYLIDIAPPNTNFTVANFQHEAYRLIEACWEKNKIPLLVGGTGLYIEAVVKGYVFEGAASSLLRRELATHSLKDLHARLDTAGVVIAPSDVANKRRLIRAVERIELGLEPSGRKLQPPTEAYHVFILTRPWEDQRLLARPMVQERLDLGLIDETQELLNTGINREWLRGMGLSYRLVIEMLEGTFPKQELSDRMVNAFRQLMRRQRTWFKNRRLGPLLPTDAIEREIKKFMEENQ